MTINERIKQVRTETKQTQEQFATSIGLKRDNLAQIETGKQLPPLETLSAIVRIYNKSYQWLIDGKEGKEISQYVTPVEYRLTGKEGGKKGGKIAAETGLTPFTKSEKGLIHADHIVDLRGNQLIPLTDIKAAAGDGYINTDDLTPEDYIYIPRKFLKYKNVPHLCVKAKGQSMSPTVHDGSWLPLSLLDRGHWAAAPDKQCYVVVDTEGKTYFKRVKNRLESRGQLTLMSDNPDKVNYANFDLKLEEIQSIWFVEFGVMFRLSNIHDQYYSRLDQFEETLGDVVQEIAKLKIRYGTK